MSSESSKEFLEPIFDKSISKNQSLVKAKPFLKRVGGKRSALEELKKRLPAFYSIYYECFLGGEALFFDINPDKACLYDINKKLIIRNYE